MFLTKLKAKYIKGSNPKDYYLDAPFIFDYKGYIINIPPLTRTDFASVPKMFQKIFPPQSKGYSKSSVIHDQLYFTKEFNKFKADWIFLTAMKIEQKNLNRKFKWFCTRWIFYISVSLFGWFSWWSKK